MKLTWKHAALAITAVVLIGGVIWAVNEFLNNVEDLREWKERAERFEDRRDSLSQEAERWRDSARSAEEAADSARKVAEKTRERAERRVKVAEEAAEAASRAADRADSGVDSAFARLRTAIVERKPKKVQLNLLNAAKTAEVREDSAKDEQIRAKDAIIAEKNDVIASQDTLIEKITREAAIKDSVNAALREKLAESEKQREKWKNEAKPDLFDMSLPRIGRDLALFAIGRASSEVF